MTDKQIAVLDQKKLDIISNVGVTSTIDSKALAEIANKMPEIDRAMSTFGRNNTQTTGTLMSLTMLNGRGSPYRLLKQCLAEINKRRSALKEAIYKLRLKNLKLQKLQKELTKKKYDKKKNIIKRDTIGVTISKIESDINETALYIEGALKDIATQQENYEQIRENNNIREDWDEADFEAAEPLFHTRRAFELLYSDLVTNGRMGKGTHEYLGQFGIHQQVALTLTTDYINECLGMLEDNKMPTSNSLETWLDKVAEQFADNHKDVLDRMGIKKMVTEFCQYKTIGNNS